jgi:hypothetical protein
MQSTCKEACIICDIDGFTGRNNSTITGESPFDFCTGEVHHMQWIGFVAGSTNLKVSVRVNNCTIGRGIEVGFYEGIDCKNYKQITFCDTDLRPGELTTFTNLEPLVIGQYYYVVMDGSSGDICDWTFKVLEGSTKLAELTEKAAISAPDVICTYEDPLISTDGVVGGTEYRWKVNGVESNFGRKLDYDFSTPGKYTICLTPSNVCNIGIENCRELTVLPVSTFSFDVDICPEECYEWNDKNYCEKGSYQQTFKNINGCDSTVTLNLSVKQVFDIQRSIVICEGDTVRIEQQEYTREGTYPVQLINSDGCKILLTLDITTVDCEVKTDVLSDSLRCTDDKTGIIKLAVSNGLPPFTYEVIRLEDESIVAVGTITMLNESILISNLSAGSYYGKIFDNSQRESFFFETVSEPDPLKLKAILSNYNGVNVSCFGANDGNIILESNGGTGDVALFFENKPIQNNTLANLSAGWYHVKYVDDNQCQGIDSFQISQPRPIVGKYEIKDAGCNGPNTGYIRLDTVVGGIEPLYMLIGNDTINSILANIKPSDYIITFVDKNGCSISNVDTLGKVEIPFLSAGNLLSTVDLGDSIRLVVEDTIISNQYEWYPKDGFSCAICLETTLLPLNTTSYQIIATSADGCKDTLRLGVSVKKDRSFLFSDIINTNSLTGNELPKYYAGKDVKTVNAINIYDRWGNLIYTESNLPAGDVLVPIHNFQNLMTGVYAWTASVTYIDKETIVHRGSFSLVK